MDLPFYHIVDNRKGPDLNAAHGVVVKAKNPKIKGLIKSFLQVLSIPYSQSQEPPGTKKSDVKKNNWGDDTLFWGIGKDLPKGVALTGRQMMEIYVDDVFQSLLKKKSIQSHAPTIEHMVNRFLYEQGIKSISQEKFQKLCLDKMQEIMQVHLESGARELIDLNHVLHMRIEPINPKDPNFINHLKSSFYFLGCGSPGRDQEFAEIVAEAVNNIVLMKKPIDEAIEEFGAKNMAFFQKARMGKDF